MTKKPEPEHWTRAYLREPYRQPRRPRERERSPFFYLRKMRAARRITR